MLAWVIDVVLHLDRHLLELLTRYELWIYPILFAVIFCETGLVVTPFLPGDSLLFAVGALAAIDTSGTLNAPLLFVLLGVTRSTIRSGAQSDRRHSAAGIACSRSNTCIAPRTSSSGTVAWP